MRFNLIFLALLVSTIACVENPKPFPESAIQTLESNIQFEDQDEEKDKVSGAITFKIPDETVNINGQEKTITSLFKNVKTIEFYLSENSQEQPDASEKIGSVEGKSFTEGEVGSIPAGTELGNKKIHMYLAGDKDFIVYSGISKSIEDMFVDVDPETMQKSNIGVTNTVTELGKIATTLSHVLFDYDKSELKDEFKPQIKDEISKVEDFSTVSEVSIAGYTDERGTVEYNLFLGEKRAKTVQSYLQSIGITSELIKTVSYGESDPINPESSEAAWAQNRRAVITIIFK